MKLSTGLKRAFTAIALFGIVYCMAVYVYLQSLLTPRMTELTLTTEILAVLVLPALLAAGLYHLFLLINALEALTTRRRRVFVHSVYLLCILFSGITILSDLTVLSDIGKEYLFWDVRKQWWLLYGSTGFHLLVIIWGYLFSKRHESLGSSVFKAIGLGNEAVFLSIHQIGFICGVLGISVIAFSFTDIIEVTQRFQDLWMLLLVGLASFPFALMIIYWAIKNREKPLSDWLDEKQMADTAMGALFSMGTDMLLLVLACVLIVAKLVILPTLFWLCLLLCVKLAVFSLTIMRRNRMSD